WPPIPTLFPYTTLFRSQLNELTKETRQPLHILDFGAGFGKTADYLANLGHQVVAYEPNQEMQNYRYHSTNYTYLTNDFEANIARSEEHTSELQSRFDLV